MTDLSLGERLQPSLLDRLIDDERVLTVYELTFERTRLEQFGVREQDLRAALIAQGLSKVERAVAEEGEGMVVFHCRAPAGRVGVSQLSVLAVAGLALERVGRVTAHNVLNDVAETPERRLAVARRLRELVGRDLSLLLNASSLEVTDELERLPNVRASVLNFGVPPYTGRTTGTAERDRLARALETAIRRFEPRLMKVRVTPETVSDAAPDQELSFRIDAELWGQPAPHQVVLRTRIDTESGKAHVSDPGSR